MDTNAIAAAYAASLPDAHGAFTGQLSLPVPVLPSLFVSSPTLTPVPKFAGQPVSLLVLECGHKYACFTADEKEFLRIVTGIDFMLECPRCVNTHALVKVVRL